MIERLQGRVLLSLILLVTGVLLSSACGLPDEVPLIPDPTIIETGITKVIITGAEDAALIANFAQYGLIIYYKFYNSDTFTTEYSRDLESIKNSSTQQIWLESSSSGYRPVAFASGAITETALRPTLLIPGTSWELSFALDAINPTVQFTNPPGIEKELRRAVLNSAKDRYLNFSQDDLQDKAGDYPDVFANNTVVFMLIVRGWSQDYAYVYSNPITIKLNSENGIPIK